MLQQSRTGFAACGGYGIGNFRRFSAGNLYVDVAHVSGSGPSGINAGFHQMDMGQKRLLCFYLPHGMHHGTAAGSYNHIHYRGAIA